MAREDGRAGQARPIGSSLTSLADRVSGTGLTLLGVGVTMVTLAGLAAVTAEHDVVGDLCLAVVGGFALVAVHFAATWRALCRRSADDATELLEIVDEIGAVVCVRDAEGRYLLVNRQFEQVLRISREKVLGARHQDLFADMVPRPETVLTNDRKALTQGAPVQTQDLVEQADGPHTYFTVRHPVADHSGRVYAVCGISTDITDLMRAEDEVRRLITDLEQRVRERTADLEASTREIDSFTYSVSHDLRTPLRALAGFSEILVEDHADQLDPDGRDYLHRVHAAAERMAATIDALLDLSHVARRELDRRPVDLGDLARDVLADLRVTEPGRQVEVEVGELPVVGDPGLLGLAMQNLVSNAWKFTADRRPARIRIGERESRGERAYYVEDNGTGFDMRYADKLFAPFQRLHGAQYPGTGIGLAIVERVVARHGGHVWAESAKDAGATFFFTLLPDEAAGSVPGPSDTSSESTDPPG
ncbi:PAS domain-containing protein [Actinospica durhamensis]|uniref:Sensor-like histidine kinase SenX3 n=1 Tax=Actinospica durhamensis TaxID=1508375 RepID=A0A941ISV9_9ACTN|nr:ATP-binding protein [Actinospica durhamensis]MBR7836862.1 PAS domain-containing protein [Actinospica durhamensis]